MSHNSLVTKPASGHWTDAYPELGRGPVSLEDCVSPDFYEKEREHVFSKTWLYVGRAERVPKSGSYFTRELRFLNTSVIIVRGKDDVIRHWARQAGITAAQVSSGQVTLNHDRGRWFGLGASRPLPARYQQVDGQWQRVD